MRSAFQIRLTEANSFSTLAISFTAESKLTHKLENSDDSLTLRLATSADFDWCKQAVLECYNYSYSVIPLLISSLYPIDNEDLMDHIIKDNTYIINHMGNQVGLIVCEKRELVFFEGFFILE